MRILSIDSPGGRIGGFAFDDNMRLSFGDIVFDKGTPEAEDFRRLAAVVTERMPDVVILERPFLWAISRYVGGLCMIAAIHHIKYWLCGASQAKKRILDNGRADKKTVLAWARQRTGLPLSQHQSDALLYLEYWRCSNELDLC